MVEELRRLERLVQDGDRSAAQRMLRVALRQGEAEAHAVAALALGDARPLIRCALEAWEAGDMAAVTTHAAQLGVTLDLETARGIDALLERSQRRIRRRRAGRGDVLHALFEAQMSSHRVGVISSRTRGGSSGFRAICVAWRRSGDLVIGVGRCSNRNPTPGSAWQTLRPWDADLMAVNAPRLEGWAQTPGEDRLVIRRAERSPLFASLRAQVPAPDEARLRALDALLEAPDAARWRQLTRQLTRWPDAHTRQRALDRARAVLDARWPDSLRCIRRAWVTAATARVPRDHLDLFRRVVMPLRAPSDLAAFTTAPARHLTQLELTGTRREPEAQTDAWRAAWAALASAPSLANLTALTLCGPARLDAMSLRALLEGDGLAALRALDARAPRDPIAWSARAWSGLRLRRPALDALALRDFGLGDAEASSIGAALALPGLRHLDLSGNRVTAAGAAALLESQALPALETLILQRNPLHKGRWPATLGAGTALRRLDLRGCQLTPDALRALQAWPGLRALRCLDLSRRDLDAAALRALTAALGDAAALRVEG